MLQLFPPVPGPVCRKVRIRNESVKKRHCLQIIGVTLIAALVSACGAPSPFESFTEQRFQALQQSGQSVLVDIHASWCQTCKRQGQVLSAFLDEHPECQLTVLSVDFDEQKNWVIHFEAPRQSTLVLFNGEEKVWFNVAETRKDVIYDALYTHRPNCSAA